MFLEQYWGGPRTYSDQRGHPRLRMRHAPFKVGPIERDAWLRCMRIAVDEAGTEAAAATAVSMKAGGAAPAVDKPIPFVADHPFLFLVRDRKNGAILFMGRLVDPP